MGEDSSRRSKRRSSSKRKDRSSRARNDVSSPPSYSVEENSDGEWVNSRLNVKWPAPAGDDEISKHRYLAFDDSSDRKQSERRSRKKRSKKEKKERKEKKRDESSKSRASRSPRLSSESPYISLSTSDTEESGRGSKRARRERKRMIVQTSPQQSRRSRNGGGFSTDEDGKKIDSIVFDTKSEMMRYKRSDDILPTKKKSRSKKPSAAEQSENEEYNRYYLGVRSRRGVESKLKRPGEFALYYERPKEGDVPASVNLQIAYLSSESEVYHYPIQQFEGVDGHNHFVVMQNKSDGKMFTSILALVKHYSLYSHIDARTGRLETFSV